MSNFSDLINKIVAELSTLKGGGADKLKPAQKPFDGSASFGLEDQFWIEHTGGGLVAEYGQKYTDSENINIVIAEKIDARNLTGTIKNLGDRRDLIRKHLTDHAFHITLPTLIFQVKYSGHTTETAEKYIKDTINFEFQIRRSL